MSVLPFKLWKWRWIIANFQGSLVFVVGKMDGLLMVSGRRHNADDIVATGLAVESIKTVYRGRWVLWDPCHHSGVIWAALCGSSRCLGWSSLEWQSPALNTRPAAEAWNVSSLRVCQWLLILKTEENSKIKNMTFFRDCAVQANIGGCHSARADLRIFLSFLTEVLCFLCGDWHGS